MNDAIAVLECQNLCKTYNEGPQAVDVLIDINFTVRAGEQVAIAGSSGAGKTTLLNLLGGLDLPSSGVVTVAGQNLAEVSETQRGLLRNRHLGFVYQFHHLLGEFSATENVAMPLLIAGVAANVAEERANQLLADVGLSQRFSHKPSELSGGERQRVAIARALVSNPACVLLDEPTGNLDRRTAESVQELMRSLNESLQISFVIVTHDEHLAKSLQRQMILRDGGLYEQ